MVKKIIKYSIYVVYLTLGSIFARLLPTVQGQLVFGSRGGVAFEGNAKYLYLYTLKNTKFRAIWIAKDVNVVNEVRLNGGEAYHYLSLNGLFSVSKAEAIFITHSMFDSAPLIWKRSQKIIDLWHGVPIKKISFEDKNQGKLTRVMDLYKKVRLNYLIAHSEHFKTIYNNNMKIKIDKIMGYGSPKVEYMHSLKDKFGNLYGDYEKVYLYLPTYRDYEYEIPLLKSENLFNINEYLKLKNSYLLFKLHPSQVDIDKVELSNIKSLNSDQDIYGYFNYSDVVISDYSSVLTDFKSIYPEKDIVVYAPDLETYTQKRGFNLEYEKVFDNIIKKDFYKVFTDTSNVSDKSVLSEYESCCDRILRLIDSVEF